MSLPRHDNLARSGNASAREAPAAREASQARSGQRLRAHLWLLALGSVFLLAGCPTDAAPGGSPLVSGSSPGALPPSGGGSISAGSSPRPGRTAEDIGATTNGTLAGAQLRVVAKDPTSGGAIAGAQVSIHGPGLAFGITSGSGEIVLGPVPLGTYELRVAAAGKVPFIRQVSLTVVRSRSTQQADLAPASRTLRGRVLDAQGAPVPGARIALGTAWAMSDADGTYTLAAGADGAAEVRKTGYEPANTSGGDIRLTRAATRISFESGAFGQAAGAAFATLRQALSQAGMQIADGDASAQIRVWAAPAEVSDSQARDATTFVTNGGKLVVLGDWAGASRYSPEAANKLLLPLGASIDANLVRVAGSTLGRLEWFTPTVATGTPAGAGTIQMLGASTVQAAGPAIRFLDVPQDGYRVQGSSDPGSVGVARQVGSGLLVVLGDASAWLDPDIGRADNLSFIRNVLLW